MISNQGAALFLTFLSGMLNLFYVNKFVLQSHLAIYRHTVELLKE